MSSRLCLLLKPQTVSDTLSPPPPPPQMLSSTLPPHVLFEMHCQAGHPGYSTKFKTNHPSSLLLTRPNKETEDAMTKYACEYTTRTPPPALHLTVLCVCVCVQTTAT